MVPLDACVYRKKDVPWRIIEGEAILVNVATGEVIHLNETGACAWNFLEDKKKVGDIVKHVYDNFEIDMDTAVSDVCEFIQGLVEKELILVCE